MFTGITRGTFPIVALERSPDLLRYTVDLGEEFAAGLEPGASVSIDGVCQTVVRLDSGRIDFDAITETLERTTLGSLVEGTLVSVERSARVGDEIGGHDVSGHVLGTGEILEYRHDGDLCELKIGVDPAWMRFIQTKGFIAIDGSSLTVGERDRAGWFWIHLIPETLRLTNFGRKKVGDRVNVELDARTVTIVETVERVLAERAADD